MKRAIFLDRDGTLNLDKGYTHKISDWQWLPGALAGLRAFNAAGWLVLVVSNQSGIGRGYYTRKDVDILETWLSAELEKNKAKINAWYYCPHTDMDACQCRKPRPGMLIKAAEEWNADLKLSWMIGDRKLDMEAGRAAGCQTGLIANPEYPEEESWAKQQGLPVWNTLLECATQIIKKS